MRYVVFNDQEKSVYPIALMVRYLNKREMQPYVAGIEDDVVAFTIDTLQKANVSQLKIFAEEMLETLNKVQVEYAIITDGALFKVLTKTQKLDRVGGYVLPCVFPGYEHIYMIYVPSPKQLIYDPSLMQKVNQGMSALAMHRKNVYETPGTDIIKFEAYPRTEQEIGEWLVKVVDQDLAIDIEAYDLKHYRAGIGTITLCWNKHQGVAFPVDHEEIVGAVQAPFGKQVRNEPVRKMLREFFEERAKRNKTRTLYHNGSYDVYVLTYQLFMDDLLDTEGLLNGLDIMFKGFEDTKLITYLATNSCAGNVLDLKSNAQEFAGDYAEDVKDITIVPMQRLLTYNLVDGLSTWFVYEKFWDKMVNDQQLDIYENLFKPMVVDIVQMQLTGLPVNMEEVKRGKAEMQADSDRAVNAIMASPEVAQLEKWLNQRYADKKNSEWKVKRMTADEADEKFNLNSPIQLQHLLYQIMGLPVIALTAKKQPSTEGDTLQALVNHTDNDSYKKLLGHIVDFKAVDKILSTFIPAFEASPQASDGWHYLFGFFNIGGTLSGRLSSNGPNLQNLPSTGSKYAKIVKKMFSAPKGWLFVGLDFASLEDRISALTTKDPNKLKVYTDGYDGHSLRAFFYFREQLPDIEDTVESINSIEVKYKPIRQESKAPTFALTYQGTFKTLMVNCGFSEKKAKMIESRYHEMYAVSDAWVQSKLTEAAKVGYVTVAFGLRVRTPLMAQVIHGNRATPHEASAEGRTAGNALGQSYCLLNSRAGMAFNRDVRKSEFRLQIKPCAQIHDAQYFLVRNDLCVVHWLNETLVPHVQWQELPEIQHDEVKLGGELFICHPNWASEIKIPNHATVDQILKIAEGESK